MTPAPNSLDDSRLRSTRLPSSFMTTEPFVLLSVMVNLPRLNCALRCCLDTRSLSTTRSFSGPRPMEITGSDAFITTTASPYLHSTKS